MSFGTARMDLFLIGAICLAAFFSGASRAMAEDRPMTETGAGPLDGMVFVGMIGSAEDPDYAEELHFNNGYFWSKHCLSCGYMPGPYWVRIEGGTIHFRGELSRVDSSVFEYTGQVSDGKIEVDVRWRKERWYWSIDQMLYFAGVLEPARGAVQIDDAGQLATSARADPLPQWCS